MYLTDIYIENVGPLRNLNLQLAVAGDPKPFLLVGANGGGKTNFLSIIADAIFEAETVHYNDVVPTQSAVSRPWFRVIGPDTISANASGALSLLKFEHEGSFYFYKSKGGKLVAAEAIERLPEVFKAQASWPDDGSVKELSMPDEQAKKIFQEGAYLFLPASRSEVPHWLNRLSVRADEFDLAPRLSKVLDKPIYVERGLDRLKQWMMSLLIDARTDFRLVPGLDNQMVPLAVGDIQYATSQLKIWQSLNQILGKILGDQSARFVWGGRQVGRLGFSKTGVERPLPLDALSAGQASLLTIFGTLVRYGDGHPAQADPIRITGICIIDELDAHMHVDLQLRALPELIALFPKVQFLLSSHSPLFALGMERKFGSNGVHIVDLPSGSNIPAEAYAEFGRALDAFHNTQAFADAVVAAANGPGKLLVLVEGETDPEYLNIAMDRLGRGALKEAVEICWVGAKDPRSGQGFHTGKDALNATANVLKAKPELARRNVLLLYDNDTNKPDETVSRLFIRSMPTNSSNRIIESGIENLLPEALISQDVFQTKESKKKNGNSVTTRNLDKSKLCASVCRLDDASLFAGFSGVIDIIEKVALESSASVPMAAS
ncbi:MAG: hypothetical protein JWQ90_3979 [Hydrocarboniphaga sp.]|uniref:AAA family ATPase n=1 Tax=Hydrocarboniphaga sp. TaxID=2033016 RepID=UPI002617E3E8|nr:AAA family ATPase [Hydrocarboniphaga sp.]MDB5971529.1 hypothetical protein [Hydrocarboniphaga sp.]